MAFLQSAPPREPFIHAPASVLWLIGVLVVAHIARIAAPAPDAILADYALNPARYGAGDLPGFALSFLSYMFLHADFTHLGVNCLWLLAFGPIVARRYGTVLFRPVCGVAGAVLFVALDWNVNVALIGASGAISGLMGAESGLYPWQGRKLQRGLVPILSRPVLLFTGMWLLANLIFGWTGFALAASCNRRLAGPSGRLLHGAFVGGMVRPANIPDAG